MDIPTALLVNSSHISTTDIIPSLLGEGTRGIVSDEILNIFTFINFGLICGILVIFGSIVNIINIVTFVKIGFKETINISLLSIAISDFWVCFSMLLFSLCYNPFFRSLDLPFEPDDFYYCTGCAHIAFSRITSCLTAFITLERCLCVAAPLKVKEIITPRRVVIFIIGVSLCVSVSMSACFYTGEYVWEFDPSRNKSIIVVRYLQDEMTFDIVLNGVHSIFIPIATSLVVIISTMFLVMTLKRKTAWRKTTSAQSASSSLSVRDARVSKMVVKIAVLFIVCYMPALCSYIAMIVEPEYDLGLKYHNLFLVIFSFHFAMESTNSSLNIFIYYSTSSIYRDAFLKLFCRNKETVANHENEK